MNAISHAQRVEQYNADAKFFAGAKFVVIKRATGKPVGDGKPMDYAFASYVRNTRDFLNNGEFYLLGV